MADYNQIVNILSEKRFQRYMQRCNDDVDAALRYYEANVSLSQACYRSLNAFEITLRNKMHFALSHHFGTYEWYDDMLHSNVYSRFHNKIRDTKDVLTRRGINDINADKMVAEFSLGFWVQMFNRRHQNLLWRPLRKIFKHLQRRHRQRGTVSSALNKAKNFRNRVFHHEPIAWRFSAAKDNYNNVMKILYWLDSSSYNWTHVKCSFNNVMDSEQQALKEFNIEVN